MPRNYQPYEVNAFVKGLITEASPLTFPEGTALALDNFELNRTGTVRRRRGMNLVSGPVTTPTGFNSKKPLSNVFEWDNPSGFVDRYLLAVQDGSTIRIFDRARLGSTTPTPVSSFTINTNPNRNVSFAAIDDYLVIAYGDGNIIRASFNGTSVTRATYRLQLRDVFGVDDGLRTGMDITRRPASITSSHLYNLRNQTWGNPRKLGNREVTDDPIPEFRDSRVRRTIAVPDGDGGTSTETVLVITTNDYPSNADTVNQALFADVQDDDDRVGRRFFRGEVRSNPVGSMEAPKGFFVMDALNRGSSRAGRVSELERANSYTLTVGSLPRDLTPNGATVVAEYAGRAFYGGFSGGVIDGDANSPQLGSYLLFSRLVRDATDLGQCYSDADPTSPDDFEPVATDGGFVKIDGARNIVGLVNLRNALYVLAENGVWSVSGGGEGFSAQDIIVNRVSDKGVSSSSSVVITDQSLVYWGDSGIYSIGPNEFGDYFPTNISNTTIQTLYERISFEDKANAVGVYDSFEQKIRWVYSGNKELIIDVNLNAYYQNTFNPTNDVRSVFTVPPFRSTEIVDDVNVDGEQVTVNGVNVTVTYEGRESALREVSYLVVSPETSGSSIRFATLTDPNFQDWGTYDARASLITGYTTFSDHQRYKDIPYLTLHFERTEDGFDDDFNPTNASSCLVRVAWEWSNSEASGRWTRQFQGYRYRRAYFANNQNDTYDTGFATIITKNKVRGKGKSFSVHFETEPLKDCHLLGWSMITGVAGNV